MQKVLHVVATGTERIKTKLADAIQHNVLEYCLSQGAELVEFVINQADVSAHGFGHALVTVRYKPAAQQPPGSTEADAAPDSANKKKEGKKNESK